MQITVDRTDLIHMIKGTGGPWSSTLRFDDVGRFHAMEVTQHNFSAGWQWDENNLQQMSEEKLFEVYAHLCIFNREQLPPSY